MSKENKAIELIRKGAIKPPEFELVTAVSIGKFDLKTNPEHAYLYGWESCLLEVGELLSGKPTGVEPDGEAGDTKKIIIAAAILALTNGVGEKPYYRREGEEVKVFFSDDCLFCVIPPFDLPNEYQEEIAAAICEAGQLLQRQADRIEQLEAANKDLAALLKPPCGKCGDKWEIKDVIPSIEEKIKQFEPEDKIGLGRALMCYGNELQKEARKEKDG